MLRECEVISLQAEQVLYKEGEPNNEPGIFIIVMGEIGLHGQDSGVYGKVTSEHTIGEDTIQKTSSEYKETAFCLSF